MTLLISWVGFDNKKDGPKPASVYIASDSRISWTNNNHFDFCRKVYGFKNSPDILGYCGDVLFPSIVLSQLIDIGDQGLLFNFSATCNEKHAAIKEKLVQLFLRYPKEVSGISTNNLQILHASRDSNKEFHCYILEWIKNTNDFSTKEATFNNFSDKLFILGSGKNEFLKKFDLYQKSINQKTSRALFHCFCDTLSEIKDQYCGGAPQLIGLYRKENARFYGIIKDNKRYLLGVEISNLFNFHNIEWRNELFEVCDGETMEIKSKAQRQPNPVVVL